MLQHSGKTTHPNKTQMCLQELRQCFNAMDVKCVYYVGSAFAPKLKSAPINSSCFQSFSHRTASPNTDGRMGVMFKAPTGRPDPNQQPTAFIQPLRCLSWPGVFQAYLRRYHWKIRSTTCRGNCSINLKHTCWINENVTDHRDRNSTQCGL